MKAFFVRIRRASAVAALALSLTAPGAPHAMDIGSAMSHCVLPAAPFDYAACFVSCIDALAAPPPASAAGGGFGGWQVALLAVVLAPLALVSPPLLRRAWRTAPHAPPMEPLGVRLLV